MRYVKYHFQPGSADEEGFRVSRSHEKQLSDYRRRRVRLRLGLTVTSVSDILSLNR